MVAFDGEPNRTGRPTAIDRHRKAFQVRRPRRRTDEKIDEQR
jgi:hypothetical protein